MNFQTLSSLWAWLAPAAANHLWQSTTFALAAAALTLMLRKNQARARYWLWLAASIKFLVPFALLAAVGSLLAPPRAPVAVSSGYYYAAEVTQPFHQFVTPVIGQPSAQHLTFAELLPAVLLLLWLIGFVAVLSSWRLRWRRVRAVVRRAMPVNTGREVAVLRRLERVNKIRKPIPLRLSAESLEPGIFGLFRPILLWPEGISAHLNDAHLEAILAHELRHVRYRDNLAAAMHALVQAIFWFHPLVWWMGARMVQERERGCDEEVIEMGSRPGVYAEGILKACEFCVGSPVASFSGVTGADLKRRIVRVMTGACGRPLTPGANRLLAAAGAAAFAAPLLFGLVSLPHVPVQLLQASGPLPSFEVTSIKPSKPGVSGREMGMRPGKFVAKDVPLKEVIKFAYNIKADDELGAAPSWISSVKYDIDAKEDGATFQRLNQLPPEQRRDQARLMVQSLLIDRFHLKASRRTEQLPVYALVVAKGGSKLTAAPRPLPAAPQPLSSAGNHQRRFDGGFAMSRPGQLTGINAPVGLLATGLAREPETGDRIVLDETGLKSYYNWTLKWTPANFGPPNRGPDDAPFAPAPPTDSSGPSLFTALQEQLGLKLVSQKAPVEVLVIDHIERPSPN